MDLEISKAVIIEAYLEWNAEALSLHAGVVKIII